MEFITVEQFKEQPIEVQKVFLDWWEPSIGDIYSFIDIEEYANDMSVMQLLSSRIQTKIANNCKEEGNRIPLFTEGQLRKFIEDKTESKISISPSLEGKYWIGYDKYAHNEDGDLRRLVYRDSVLNGLWKVACIVAKEGLNEECSKKNKEI